MSVAAAIQAAAARGAVACEHCDADYQVTRDPECPGVTHLNVFHDEWCPFYRQRLNRAARRASGRGK